MLRHCIFLLVFFFFFFSSRRRHTRYWRDWSSDVCSSDLVLFTLNRPHVLHAAHVVHAVHGRTPGGSGTLATPIMASRVTSAASSSSLNFSLPAGRSGSTR